MDKFVLVVLATILAVAYCDLPLIPGFDTIGAGIDGATLQKRDLPALKYTWDDSYTWTNPIYPEMNYKVPMEVIIQDDVESLLVDGAIVFTTVDDYQQKTEVRKTKHHGFLGMGRKSTTTIDYYHRFYEEDKSLTFNYQYHAWYKMSIPPFPPAQLHPVAAKMISSLPDTYNTDPNSAEYIAYRKFVNYFGTHYIDSVVMGGRIKSTAWYHKCLIDTYSLHWVSEQSGWSFLGVVNSAHGHNTGQYNVSQLWSENSWSEIKIEGGKAEMFQPDQWQDWVKTIKYNPSDIYYTMSPISDLIQDPVRKANMEVHTKQYMQEAYDEGEALKQSIIPKNPLPVPSWCHQ